MTFTPEQEQEMIERNMPKIYRAVDNFTARCSMRVANIPYEDFVQEVSIMYLQYIRRCETIEDTQKFPWYSAMEAMRNLILVSQPFSCEKSTHRFSEIIHSMPSTISMDAISASTGMEIDGMSKHWVDDKDTQMDFDGFMQTQPDYIKRIASMRIYGMTQEAIGRQCGVSHVAIHKKLNRLNEDYKKYMEGAEE